MSEIKQIRGQLRQIAKELLPELLHEQQYAALKAHVDARISEVEKFVKQTMTEMNERHKDTMGYLVRQSSTPIEPDKK